MWQFTINLLKFYPPTVFILVNLLCKPANPPMFLGSNLQPKIFGTVIYSIVTHTYRMVKLTSHNIIVNIKSHYTDWKFYTADMHKYFYTFSKNKNLTSFWEHICYWVCTQEVQQDSNMHANAFHTYVYLCHLLVSTCYTK